MTRGAAAESGEQIPFFLAGDGICSELARSIDWAKTPLGSSEGWSASLQSTVGMVLRSRHPMFLWWGPELIQFYNDAYLPSLGKRRHPAAMGQRGAECWQEIWPIIWPSVDDVMSRGQPSWNEDRLVPRSRDDRIEDVYWTYGYSPVFTETGAVGGTLVVCTETTVRVLGERRARTLRALMERTLLAKDWAETLHATAAVFEASPRDIPFALLFSVDPKTGAAALAESAGVSGEGSLQIVDAQKRNELARSIFRADGANAVLELDVSFMSRSAPEPVTQALVLPITVAQAQARHHFVVFGINPRVPLDAAYRAHLRDLTEYLGLAQARIAAARARSAAEDERNNLLLQAPVATALLTGPEHVFQLVNPLYCKLAGRSEQALIGKTYAQAFPELADTILPKILDSVYLTGTPYVTSEQRVPLVRPDGGPPDECFVMFNLEPLRDVSGDVYGMMAVAVDISEQVRARHAMKRAHDERVQLLDNLEAASRAKDEFLAMLGHELRNPLAPIVTALQLLKMNSDGPLPRELQVIERQVKHLVRLVDDLLDVSKITRGKVVLKKEWVEIADVLSKAVEMASFLLEQRGHHLRIDAPRPGLLWEGDPVRLAQVVSNLLTNAARYTDIGGDIRLSAVREAGEIVLSVKDSGMGISPEMLPRIFDLFVQGKQSADRAEGGLGLGLTLVKNLVALHGGTVSARSEGTGRGSEFVVRLPVVSAEIQKEGSQPNPEPLATGPSPRPKRILIVDDNADAAELLGAVLRAVGHEVRIVNEPLSALALMPHFRPEIAILDIGLPVMDGYELAARLRALPDGAHCRLIAVTGYGQAHDRARSEAAGFAQHLVKPVDLPLLVKLIGEKR